MKQASISIYLNRKSGDFVVSKQFFDKGLNFDGGRLVRLSRKEMERGGRQLFADHIQDFQTAPWNKDSEFKSMTKEDLAAFEKAHKEVTVYHLASTEIKFTPWKRWVKRGHRSGRVAQDKELATILTWPTTDEEFFKVLIAAFENAE